MRATPCCVQIGASGLADAFALTVGDLTFEDDETGEDELPAFGYAAARGRFEVVRWLARRFGLTEEHARMCDNYAIHQSCENGHLEVAKWLHASFKITADDVKSDGFAAFVGSCSSGHLDVAMWVADTFAVTEGEARAHGSEALRNALYGNFDIVLAAFRCLSAPC